MISERTRPIPTAAATGRNSVATNVAITAICEMRPVRRIARTSPTRNDPIAAKISTAANVDITTAPTRPEKSRSSTAIHMPRKIEAHRPAAPAERFKAVWPTEPPTG